MKVEKVREKDGKVEIMAELEAKEVAKELQRIAAYEIQRHGFTPTKTNEDPVETVRKRMGAQEAAFLFDESIMRHRTPFALTAIGIDVIGKPVFRCLEHADENKDFEFHLVCVPVPEFTLDDYGPVKIVLPSYTVKQEEIDEEIDKMAQASAVPVTNTSHDKVMRGDKVDLALETTLDGEKIKPLCAQSREYTTGALAMPDEFDAAIVGMKVGETKSFTFDGPELELDENGMPIMKTYECTATVNRILDMKTPEIGDEWARTTLPGVKSMADLRKKVEEKVQKRHEDDYNRQAEMLAGNELAKRLHEQIPDLVYGVAVKEAKDQFVSHLKEQKKTLEEYLKEEGIENDQLNQHLMMQVRQQLTRQFALNAYAKYRGLKVEEEDLGAFFESIAPGRSRQAQNDFRRDGRMYAARCAALRLKASRLLVKEAEIKHIGTQKSA